MKHLLAILSLLTAMTLGANAQQAYLGTWHGKLTAGEMSITIGLNLTEGPDGTLACTMDSPDQGAKGIKAEASMNGLSLEVKIPILGAGYKGFLMNNKIIGTFSQMGQEVPLVFEKGEEVLIRTQIPQPPFPYKEEEVTFCNKAAGATLAGTLLIPDSPAPGDPVVIMVTGSGQEDRNEEVYDHKPFLVIADYLARNGIASLRYDDRNFGESRGGDVANATTPDFRDDAKAGVEYLKARGGFGKIGVLGHSEGGSIAFMLGAAAEVDFIISLAGVGVKGDEALTAQANRILELQGTPQRYSIADFRSTVKAQQSPWLNWFIDYDPLPDIQACNCPVLAINGDRDTQVIASLNLSSIKANLPQNPKNQFREYPGLNHLFQHCNTGAPTEYRAIEETCSPEVLKDIAEWIKQL